MFAAPLVVQPIEGFDLHFGAVSEKADRFEFAVPSQPPIEQLIALLDSRPDVYPSFSYKTLSVGLCALAIRWGSYFATLVDENSPLQADIPGYNKTQPDEYSLITDSEMKRMNIEISYNFYRLVQVCRERGSTKFNDLLTKAHAYLPMPHKAVTMNRETVTLLFSCVATGGELVRQYERGEIPGVFTTYENGSTKSSIRRVESENTDRFLANTLTVQGWRNTVIERIHGGTRPPHGLTPHQRRMTKRAYLEAMRTLTANCGAMLVMWDLLFDPNYRYQDLPFYPNTATALANSYCGLSGSQWTLNESSSVVQLYKSI